MEKHIKAIMAFTVASFVFIYVVGLGAYMEKFYADKIQTLEKDIAAYDSRHKELTLQKSSLESTRLSLITQLALEQEKARLAESQKTQDNQQGGGKNDAGVNPEPAAGSEVNNAALGLEKPTIPDNTPPQITGGGASTQAGATNRVTSASGAPAGSVTNTPTNFVNNIPSTQTGNTQPRVTSASGAPSSQAPRVPTNPASVTPANPTTKQVNTRTETKASEREASHEREVEKPEHKEEHGEEHEDD